MLRTALIAGLLFAASAPAAIASDAPAAAAYSTAATSLCDLIDNPATKVVLDKHIPGVSTNPQIAQARGMTLKQIQGFAPGMITEDALAQIDADLSKIPAKK